MAEAAVVVTHPVVYLSGATRYERGQRLEADHPDVPALAKLGVVREADTDDE